MKKKKISELENLVEQTKRKEKVKKEKVDWKWILIITKIIRLREIQKYY